MGNAVTLIADATIPNAKILFNSASVPGSALANGAVTATQLADDAVTAAKLGNESTVDLVTTLPASGAFTGQFALDTDDDKAYVWDGSQWVSFKAAGSINTVVGSSAGIVNISVATSGDQVTITTSLDNTTGAAEFLAGPTGSSGAVGYRAIVGTDLPAATTTTKGAVIVNGEGLRMDGDTIEVNNDVTASATSHLVTYDAKGLVTGGRGIQAGDLPAATISAKGGIIVGTGLSVDGTGLVNHSNNVVSGTATKITFDTEGHVTGSLNLDAADIPDLATSKITSGTFSADRIGTSTITGPKLANYAVSKIGETQPTADHIGQFFFNPLSRDLFLWDGNVFQPIGISVGEIVFAGTFDASAGGGTGLVASVTAEGTAIGLVVGQALPAAATNNSRYYLVVSEAGTITSGNAPNVSLSPPDIVLSNGTNWTEIDVSQTVTAQVASNVSFTPAGNISATNVQTALEELDSEKVGATSPTFTGDVTISTAGTLIFEGATANAFETTLTVTDPTADRTLTLPDVSGTVITTGDTGSVTNAMLAGSIADSKLSTISTADKVSLSALNIDGATDIGAALADTDLFVVDDGASGANRKAAATRITDYAFGKVTGDVTIASNGTAAIGSGVIVNADISASAAIAYNKLASLTAGNIVLGNASNVATSTAVTGDVTISSSGVTAIGSGVIVDADINASAAISYSKLASLTSGNIIVGNGSNVATSTAVTGDVTISNTGVTSITSGAVVNADINSSAAIAFSKLASLSSGNILVGSAGNVPTSVAVSGDVSLSNTGVATVVSGSTSVAGKLQLTDSTSSTSTTTAATANAVKSAYDTASAALARSGGTITGELLIGNTGSFAFEGSTDNAYETYLVAADPTADRTITLPNVSGTVITTGDTATVTNAMLAGSIADTKLNTISTANKVGLAAVDIDGGTDIGAALADADLFIVDDGGAGTNRKAAATRITDYTFGKISGDITITSGGTASIGSGVIVNADINASAAIADTKLATISTAGKVSGSAITSGTIGGSTAINTTGTITTTGETTLKEIKETVYTLATSGTIALDPANGSIQSSVLTGAPTFTDSLQAGQTIVLHLEGGATYTVTWPTITWVTGSGNAAPTLTAKDTLVLWKISTTLYGAYVGSYA